MSAKGSMGVIALLIVIFVGFGAVYRVDMRQKAIVFQLGEIVRSAPDRKSVV